MTKICFDSSSGVRGEERIRTVRGWIQGGIATVAFLFAVAPLSACSSCSDGSAFDAGMDSGPGTDSDTDTDTDSNTDSGSDTNTETDSDYPEGFVADAGPWDWEDLPDAGDCGTEGCSQLTFIGGIYLLGWDVWDGLLTFSDGDTSDIHVVDYYNKKHLLMPNAYPSHPVPEEGVNFYPETYERSVCYTKLSSNDSQLFSDVLCADLDEHLQKLVFHFPQTGDGTPNPGKYLDMYGSRIVSMGGCGEEMDSWPLCAFDINSPDTYQELMPSYYGSHNSIWGDIAVWYKETGGFHIQAYDFSTGEQFDITNDDEVQFNPRIYENKIVYQDLRYGDGGTPMTSWAHSAVFLYDLTTHETTQITNGEWIAAYPDVYDNIIVWADYRNSADPNDANSFSGVEIWGYNLDTATEFQITSIPGRGKTTPRIWEEKVFVQMYKEAGGDAIYMFDLPAEAKAKKK